MADLHIDVTDSEVPAVPKAPARERAPITSLDDELTRLEVEDAIMQLEGIESARIVPGQQRVVDELHALITVDREPKHVARDLQTLLLTRFGIEVDRRVISVVRLGRQRVVEQLGASLPRLTLDVVNVSVRADDTSVSVELLDPEENYILGSAGPIPGDAVVTTTAHAAADALDGAMTNGGVRVLDAQVVPAGAHRVAMVLVEVSTATGREVLSGSAVVRRNEADSVARAVLDATNRLQD